MLETWTASYPGLVAGRILSFSYAASNGISPGRITMRVVGFDHSPAATGDFAFAASDSGAFLIENCAYLPSSTSFDFGDPITRITLLDRRWAWKYGTIDGEYNRRLADGSTEHNKTPRELATLLLEAMKETGYNVSELPAAGEPAVSWRKVNPAAALESLCKTYGLVVSLKSTGTNDEWGNKIILRKVGEGTGIPSQTLERTRSESGSIGALPSRIQAAAGPIRFLTAFKLEAVGRELDDTIKLIDDLSYKPAGVTWGETLSGDFSGIEASNPDTEAGRKETRKLIERARSDIFRMWRVKEVVGGHGAGNLNPPGYDSEPDADPEEGYSYLPDLTELKQLSVQSHTGKTIVDNQGVKKLQPIYVTGIFYPLDSNEADNVEEGTKWPSTPSLGDKGHIVRLSSAAFTLSDQFDYELATLYLHACCEVEHPELHVPVYYAEYRDADTQSQAGTQQQSHPDVRLLYETPVEWDSGAVTKTADPTSNLSGVQTELNYYLDAMEDEYVNRPAGEVVSMGLNRIELAGDIQSVSWSAGNGPPTSKVGLNSQVNPRDLDYKESQKQSDLELAAKNANEANQQAKDVKQKEEVA